MFNKTKSIFLSFLYCTILTVFSVNSTLADYQLQNSKYFKNAVKEAILQSYTKEKETVDNFYYSITDKCMVNLVTEKTNAIKLNKLSTDEEIRAAETEQFRLHTAYKNQAKVDTFYTYSKNNRMLSNDKTYQEIKIDQFIKQISTQLIMGQSSLTYQLCAPTIDLEVIQEAQKKQKFFEKNKNILDTICESIKESSSGEKALLDMYDKNYAKNPFKKYKSKIPFVKQSATYLNVATLKPIAISLITPLAYHNSESITSGLKILPFTKDLTTKTIKYGIKNLEKGAYCTSINNLLTLEEINLVIANGLSFLGNHYITYHIDQDLTEATTINSSELLFLGSALVLGTSLFKIYKKRTSKQETTLHQSLINSAKYIKSADKIYTLMQTNPTLKEQFPQFCPIYENLRDGSKTKPIINDLLYTNTFTGEPSFFSNIGRIALVDERLHESIEEFIPLMQQMGEIDKYASLVQYKKSIVGPVKFIYTQPTAAEKAKIHGINFAHPGDPNSIPNSISIGGDKKPYIDVTGPNGCGKSFGIKAAIANIITASTLGIALADTFEISPINKIIYAANVSDNQHKSKYQAEVEVMSNLYKDITEAYSDEQSVAFILDEVPSATNPNGITTGITEMVKRLSANNNNKNIGFIITHNDLSGIDHLLDHYHVNDGDEKFKLKPGKSTYSNAEQLLFSALNSTDAIAQTKKLRKEREEKIVANNP